VKKVGIKLLLLAVISSVLLGLVVAWPSVKEPKYKGQSLTQLLTTLQASMEMRELTSEQRESQKFCVKGIREIGTNAIPWLVEWTITDKVPWQQRVSDAIQTLPRLIKKLFMKPAYQALSRSYKKSPRPLASLAFMVLQERGAPAVPGLTRCLRDPRANFLQKDASMEALCRIGQPGLPTLLEVLKSSDTATHQAAASHICNMINLGAAAEPVVPEAITWLNGQNRTLAGEAAHVLGWWQIEPGVVIPALMTSFQSTNGNTWLVANSGEALAKFGEQSRAAVPVLMARLNDRDTAVRRSATNALLKIAPEVLTCGATNYH
jgi:hypothetical protein